MQVRKRAIRVPMRFSGTGPFILGMNNLNAPKIQQPSESCGKVKKLATRAGFLPMTDSLVLRVRLPIQPR
jgi:hypothetical protein